MSFNGYQKLPVHTLQLSVIGPNKDDVSVKQGNSHSLIGAEQRFEIFWARLRTSAVQVHILKNSHVFIICKPGLNKLICSAFKK